MPKTYPRRREDRCRHDRQNSWHKDRARAVARPDLRKGRVEDGVELMCRWSRLRDGRGIERSHQLASQLVGQVNDGADIGNRFVNRWRILAVVQQFVVQVHLEPATTGGSERQRYLLVSTGDQLSCQANGLVPVASSNAVNDLQLRFTFHDHHLG